MRDVNEIHLRGRLVQDAEIYEGDHPRGSLRMATNISFRRQNGEWDKRTAYHSLTYWGERGVKACRLLKKGQVVDVVGEVQYTQTTKQNGEAGYFTNILVSDLLLAQDPAL